MADETPNNPSLVGDLPGTTEVDMSGQPQAGVIAQYVKDLSFENPNAPAIYNSSDQPQIDVQFNIGATTVGENVHEVVLKIDVTGKWGDQTGFVVDLSYAGLFALQNIPDGQLQPFLLGEAPRILFPFARRVLADTVRDGGFQPLMLEPIDFQALFLAQAAQASGHGTGEFGHA